VNHVYKGRVDWTPEMERRLIELRNYGLRFADIGEQLGITASAAEGRYHKLKRQQKEQGND